MWFLFGMSVACWLYAAYNVVQMVGHRQPGVSRFDIAIRGIAFWTLDPRYFQESARPYRKKFVLASVGFFVLGAAAVLLTGSA